MRLKAQAGWLVCHVMFIAAHSVGVSALAGVVDAFHGKDIGTHWLTGSGPWPAAAGSYPHVCTSWTPPSCCDPARLPDTSVFHHP